MAQKGILQRYGVDTQDVDNGRAALNLLIGNTFNLIIIDINPPAIDGRPEVITVQKKTISF